MLEILFSRKIDTDALLAAVNIALSTMNTAQFVTAASETGLGAERVLTNTTNITWDFTTPGQAKANVGTITASQVSDFTEATQDVIGALLVDSTTIDVTYNDAGNSFTIVRAAYAGGDVTSGLNSIVLTIGANAVDNTKAADMAQSTIKGRTAGAGTGDPVDLSVSAVQTILGMATASTDNVVVRYDGTTGGLQGSAWTISDAAALTPTVSGTGQLGTGTLQMSSAFFTATGFIDWGNGDVRITGAANQMLFTGGTATEAAYSFDSTVRADGTSQANQIAFSAISTDSGAASGPALHLFRSSGSPAASDAVGRILFGGLTSTAAFASYGEIQVIIDDATNGTTDSRLRITTLSNNSGVVVDFAGTNLSMPSGYVLNFNNDVLITHSTDLLTLSGGNFSIGTGGVFTAGTIELGAASDTTISRSAAGVIAVEGVPLFSNVPQNSQSAAYTTVLADAQKHILHPTADNNARTFTIDSNANVAYPVGTAITFVNQINTVTISITSDTMTLAGSGTTGNRTLAANGIATALKIATTSWIISGTGLT